MFGNRIKLFTLLGFKIYVDASWLILAFVITWSLASGFFPFAQPGLAPATYWWMGIAGAFGLFASIIFHELGHSVIARRYGIPMKGITLFIFGGVAEMTREPPNAKSEFMMAIAGPIASILAAGFFYLIYLSAPAIALPLPAASVFGYLATINVILAVFNMVPAFPLDGGRVLRAALWGWKNDLPWATRISSALGSGFGIFLMIMGVLSLFSGNIIGGIWWFILGIFIRGASRMAYQQVLLREVLEGEPVRNFLFRNPVSVTPATSVRELVDHYIYQYHHKFFPVVEAGRVVGCVTLDQVKEIPSDDWTRRTVGDIARPCGPDNTIHPQADAMKAFTTMNTTGASRLMVIDDDRLVGVLALKDLMNFLALKLEIEGAGSNTPTSHPHHPAIGATGSNSPAR
jgi:Zn-dependent protease/CBS domain-containing protein